MLHLLERRVTTSLRREREPMRRWQMIATLLAAVVALALPVVVALVAPDHYGGWRWALRTFAGLVYGWLAGVGLVHLSGITRRLAWQRGYRAGRDSMIDSLGEARTRGLTFPDWIVGEMQRDGVPVAVTHDGDGHVIAIALRDERQGDA